MKTSDKMRCACKDLIIKNPTNFCHVPGCDVCFCSNRCSNFHFQDTSSICSGETHNMSSFMTSIRIQTYKQQLIEEIPQLIPDIVNIVIEYLTCELKPGCKLDAADYYGHWYQAEILEKSDVNVLIHYTHWDARWNEWVPITMTDRFSYGGTKAFGHINKMAIIE